MLNMSIVYNHEDVKYNSGSREAKVVPGHSKGSFTLEEKRHRFQMGSQRIQFNVHIEQRQRSKEKSGFAFAFVQCK